MRKKNTDDNRSELTVIGGGLAGSEAAWQAAERGLAVTLFEMRPEHNTPAHTTDQLAELVCSNSLGAVAVDRALGLLKEEMRRMGSLILNCAEAVAVPAGGALAVDRDRFSRLVTERILAHPNIRLVRREITAIPQGPTIIASGPLTSDALASEIGRLTGQEHMFFWDAIAPIVKGDTVDMNVAFQANRYGRGENPEGDYLNCPMNQQEYEFFVDALLSAELAPLRDFESRDRRFFEACLPVEVLAARDRNALAFGPLRPVGLHDPRTGKRPFAVVQLRQDNKAATLFNMVGFQTNLRWQEQDRVFRLIPGLQQAEFVRFGQMHRNSFVCSPALLDRSLRLQVALPESVSGPVWMAGQITGTEGYVGSTMGGLIAGLAAACHVRGIQPPGFPLTTMTGALLDYVSGADALSFQPMKANFGLLPALDPPVRGKRVRYAEYARRALEDLTPVLASFSGAAFFQR